MPIGGVLAAKRAVVPYAIGVDIGCGVVLAKTGLEVGAVTPAIKPILDQILRDVPVGNGPGAQFADPQCAPELGPVPDSIQPDWWNRAATQLGSLGGGNHFIELQADEDDQVYIMLHSGSRSLGKNICDFYAKLALERNHEWYSVLPDKDLAFLPHGTEEFEAYWEAMDYAMKFAESSRDRMMTQAQYAINRHAHTGSAIDFDTVADCHHNYAAWERHYGENVIVHRKGAVRAQIGDDVLIPGSMGAFSYWATGKGNPESFNTSPHGAGRQLARKAATRAFKPEDMERQVAAAGNTLATPDRNAVLDELPAAYKPIDEVMEDSEALVSVVKKLRPIGTVKG
jgi:tRNA-splicing ligase RtcB